MDADEEHAIVLSLTLNVEAVAHHLDGCEFALRADGHRKIAVGFVHNRVVVEVGVRTIALILVEHTRCAKHACFNITAEEQQG